MGDCCSTSNVSSPTDATNYLTKITGSESGDLKNASLVLDLSNGKHQEIFSKLSEMKLPKFGSISLIKVIKEDLKLIDTFASYSVRQKLSIFSLSGVDAKIPADIEGLFKLGSCVTQCFTLKNLKIEKDYLAKIIESAIGCLKIEFIDCAYTGKSHFNIKDSGHSRIETLSFISTNPKYKFGLDDLKGLAIKMAETSIKESLRTVCIGQLDEKTKVRVIMNDAGFGNINVEQEESASDQI